MRVAVAVTVAVFAAALVGTAAASAPPVGPLPAGPTSTIVTTKGQLVSIALPHRSGGKVWRIAQNANPKVLKQVTEGDVGPTVVLVFKATGSGTTTIKLGLTLGEKTKAYESRTYVVRVR
jgi:hypothetical protein